jgi:hypothetical protein
MKCVALLICFLLLFVHACGNNEDAVKKNNEKTYSRELGQKAGESINEMTQKAKDAAAATQKRLDDAKETGLE